MSFLYVGEGKNDEDVVPIILEEHGFECPLAEFVTWSKLHFRGRKGFQKKAKWAFIQAREKNRRGVVATLDADNQPSRLDYLKKAREEDRKDISQVRFPIIVGQAKPELEAWLLDDPKAVKEGLSLSSDTSVPKPQNVSDVKEELNSIISTSEVGANRTEALKAIARKVRQENSRKPSASGLGSFLDDAKSEIDQQLNF